MGVPDGGPSGGMLCIFAAMVRVAERYDLRSSWICGAMFRLQGIFDPKGRRFLAKFSQGKSVGKRCHNAGSKRESGLRKVELVSEAKCLLVPRVVRMGCNVKCF